MILNPTRPTPFDAGSSAPLTDRIDRRRQQKTHHDNTCLVNALFYAIQCARPDTLIMPDQLEVMIKAIRGDSGVTMSPLVGGMDDVVCAADVRIIDAVMLTCRQYECALSVSYQTSPDTSPVELPFAGQGEFPGCWPVASILLQMWKNHWVALVIDPVVVTRRLARDAAVASVARLHPSARPRDTDGLDAVVAAIAADVSGSFTDLPHSSIRAEIVDAVVDRWPSMLTQLFAR